MVGVFGADDPSVPILRDPVILREQILYQLRKVIDPDLYKDIVSCGFVKNLQFDFETGNVNFTLQLTTASCPVKDQFVDQCTTLLKELEWVETVDITLSAQKSSQTVFPGDSAKNLENVSFILAVSSCKGGVGKSSLAVNLAYMLKRLGARVGICDCDVYGPSLHSLIPISNPKVYFQVEADDITAHDKAAVKETIGKGEGVLVPLEHGGVKLMSYSYFRPEAEAYAGVRGPIASSLVYQMVTQTKWGTLDYLILDLPPGTGDIHLTLAQSIRISGAVVVTTPQQLSLIDMEKGVHFFEKVNIPTVALIENMAYVSCPRCHGEINVFKSTYDLNCKSVESENNGPGNVDEASTTSSKKCCTDKNVSPLVERLIEQFGMRLHLRLPLDPLLSAVSFHDTSKPQQKADFPFAAVFGETCPLWVKLKDFCSQLTREVSTLVYGADRVPDITTTSDGLLQISIQEGPDSHTVYMCPLRSVRLKCPCAQCVDENTGQLLLKPRSVPIDVHILTMKQTNNYSVRIGWSDGHQSMISYRSLINLSQKVEGRAAAACAQGEELEW